MMEIGWTLKRSGSRPSGRGPADDFTGTVDEQYGGV